MILNRQRTVAVSLPPLERFWRQLRETLRLSDDSMTICLVSEAQMARWNRAYRSKRGATDVLSFPVESGAGARRPGRARARTEAAGYLGDIAIAPTVARQNARRLGRSLGRELRILMLHGTLHLLGYDHERDHGEMNRLERRLRRRLGLEPARIAGGSGGK